MKPKCANCGHPYESHAIDRNFPDTERCFHGAGTGEGCTPAYKDRCKKYVHPEEGQ